MSKHHKALLVATIVATLAGVTALAHHGFTGRYDTDSPVFLVGQVIALNTAPPHATIVLTPEPSAIPPPSGADRPTEMTGHILGPDRGYLGRRVTVEFPPVRAFFDLGNRISPGDTVEIIALRNCAPPHQLRSQWIRVPGRDIVQREGRLSYMVRGCTAP